MSLVIFYSRFSASLYSTEELKKELDSSSEDRVELGGLTLNENEAIASYKKIAGEVEARNVESRMNMSAEARRSLLAAETEDVAREDQIFLDEALGETRFRTLEEVNAEFNDNLQKQIDGTLPQGFVYQLGYPSDVLRSAGINNLPIELVASRLVDKSMQENHPFDLKEVENLPEAIQNPLAVFISATKVGSNVIFTELRHGGKNFVAILRVKENKKKIEVNQIRSLYPKNTSGIIEWINSDLATYMDKKRMIEWIENQRNESLSKPQSNSVEVRKQLVSAANIIKDFENPNISDGNSTRFRKSSNLKESLGNEYDATMTSIYDSMSEEEKGIYGSNPVKAAEQYSTNIAESMNDLSAIKKLSAIIKGTLEKMGFDVKLSDGDAMYALWKSGNAIKDSDTAFEALEKGAKDFAVQQLTEEYDVLFRKKKPLDALNLSQDQKNKLQGDIQSKMELIQEAYADRMIAVKKLQEEIEAKTGKKLPDHMNVYVFENTLSSRNDYERRVFEQPYKEPLIEAVKSMTEKGANQRDIENYVMLKHALERRDVMMQKELDEYIKSLPQPDPALIQAKQDAILQKDYSGMTGILADIKGIRRETFESQMEAKIGTIVYRSERMMV